MNPLAYVLAPVLLLPAAIAPLAPASDASAMAGGGEGAGLVEQQRSAEVAGDPAEAYPFEWFAGAFRGEPANQVRIEQSITIRVAPRGGARNDPRMGMMPEPPMRDAFPRLVERPIGKCVPVSGIAGVQIDRANKLMLFMRDSRVVSASLDKGCSARDFYSGFYVARSEDGMMCTGRDTLQSRTGASCKLGKMRQIVDAEE